MTKSGIADDADFTQIGADTAFKQMR